MAKKTAKKKKAPKKPAKKASRKSTRSKAKRKQHDDALPGPHVAEHFLQGIFGDAGDCEFNAQQHAYEAMDAMADEDWERAHREATKAVKIDPNCVDALHVLSHLGSEDEGELVDNLRRTVARGERALGKKFFQENAGWFWGLLETRPYMRARAQLAELLMDAGKVDEAIGHFEEMLELNPNDNQGLRYSLLGCYLEQENLEGAKQLFSQYPEEWTAMFAWGRVLASLLAGDESAAVKQLSEARRVNKRVEAYLVGRKKVPKDGPGYYSPGEPSEAIVCMREIGGAWTAQPAAIDWLKRQKTKRK